MSAIERKALIRPSSTRYRRSAFYIAVFTRLLHYFVGAQYDQVRMLMRSLVKQRR